MEELTPEDYKNLSLLIDRVTTTGVQEANIVVNLHIKLVNLANSTKQLEEVKNE